MVVVVIMVVVLTGPPSRSFARIASAASLMPGIVFKSSFMGDKIKLLLNHASNLFEHLRFHTKETFVQGSRAVCRASSHGSSRAAGQ
jgi:hypothetical protein